MSAPPPIDLDPLLHCYQRIQHITIGPPIITLSSYTLFQWKGKSLLALHQCLLYMICTNLFPIAPRGPPSTCRCYSIQRLINLYKHTPLSCNSLSPTYHGITSTHGYKTSSHPPLQMTIFTNRNPLLGLSKDHFVVNRACRRVDDYTWTKTCCIGLAFCLK